MSSKNPTRLKEKENNESKKLEAAPTSLVVGTDHVTDGLLEHHLDVKLKALGITAHSPWAAPSEPGVFVVGDQWTMPGFDELVRRKKDEVVAEMMTKEGCNINLEVIATVIGDRLRQVVDEWRAGVRRKVAARRHLLEMALQLLKEAGAASNELGLEEVDRMRRRWRQQCPPENILPGWAVGALVGAATGSVCGEREVRERLPPNLLAALAARRAQLTSELTAAAGSAQEREELAERRVRDIVRHPYFGDSGRRRIFERYVLERRTRWQTRWPIRGAAAYLGRNTLPPDAVDPFNNLPIAVRVQIVAQLPQFDADDEDDVFKDAQAAVVASGPLALGAEVARLTVDWTATPTFPIPWPPEVNNESDDER